jgi:hypothetical protein
VRAQGRAARRRSRGGRCAGEERGRGKIALASGDSGSEGERRESGRAGGRQAPTSGARLAEGEREGGESARVGAGLAAGPSRPTRERRGGESWAESKGLGLLSSFLLFLFFLFYTQIIQTNPYEFK